MKTQSCVFWFLILLIISFSSEAQNLASPRPVNGSTYYTGPIIDMHIHAFDENSSFNRMLGQEMDLAMTGKVYKASSSMEKLKEETFAKFEKNNIVKAMVSQ